MHPDALSIHQLRKQQMEFTTYRHGHAPRGNQSPTYRCWANMRKRCNSETSKDYINYGGRGITVCDRWSLFDNFLADMGEKPRRMTLDRIDNDQGYSPENCRWTTRTEQSRNRRGRHMIEWQGRVQCTSAWAEELGFGRSLIYDRLRWGWSIERAFTTPVRINR